ncbi:MAG: ABC transporter ATP-binding protein [Actinobacteria bacterium]|nr:ABC transporter ATP-binding protein [Actinomycetota bacterium]
MTHAIDVQKLRKRYGDRDAVRDVSFTVDPGEVFCLLGPNGASKTTTTEILEGYRLADGGTVRVLGHDPAADERGFRERIGIVLQECGVQPDLSVAELVRMYGRYYPHPRPVDELLDLVGLTEKRNSRAKTLSGGQKRRLDLALGLVGDPELLFLDEPTTGFDPSARRAAWATIRDLCALGKTVFLTTHFMDEAQELADRIAVIANGSIVAMGTPDELGGRDTAATEIRFHLPAGLTTADLPSLPSATVSAGEHGVLVRSTEGIAVTNVITGWAIKRRVTLANFSVSQPSLEDMYLRLTADAHATTNEPVGSIR